MADESPINKEEAGKRISALLERRKVVSAATLHPIGSKSGTTAGGIVKHNDDTYMAKFVLTPQSFAEWDKYMIDCESYIESLNNGKRGFGNVSSLQDAFGELTAFYIKNVDDPSKKNSKEQSERIYNFNRALKNYTQYNRNHTTEEQRQAEYDKLYAEMDKFFTPPKLGIDISEDPAYDRSQMLSEFVGGALFKRLLPNKASDVALVSYRNEVATDPKTKVSSIMPDPKSTAVGTRSEFLQNFQTLEELADKELKKGGTKAKAWSSVQGFSDVIAASYMVGDYDIHHGNIGVIDNDGTWQAVKIDHGFVATNIKDTESHLLKKYINMSAAPSFEELYDDLTDHLQYNTKKEGFIIPLTPEQLKKSIDDIQARTSIEEMIDSTGQRLYAASQIGLISNAEAELKYQNISQALSDRYHGMKDLSKRLGTFLESEEYKSLSPSEQAKSWLYTAVKYEQSHPSILSTPKEYPKVKITPLFLSDTEKHEQAQRIKQTRETLEEIKANLHAEPKAAQQDDATSTYHKPNPSEGKVRGGR